MGPASKPVGQGRFAVNETGSGTETQRRVLFFEGRSRRVDFGGGVLFEGAQPLWSLGARRVPGPAECTFVAR